MSLRKSPERTEALVAANQANGRKSLGRIPPELRRKIEEMAARYPVRLLGLAETRVLNQDLGAAERLYRELIAPYEPDVPPLLAHNFQDLARYYLELEAWERIRDAQLEHRWEQNKHTQMRLAAEFERDLQGNVKQYMEGGLQSLPDSPAKFRMQVQCLEELSWKLNRHDFDLKTQLTYLYGKDFAPKTDRAETLCFLCRRVMEVAPGEEPPKEDLERLLELINEEQLEVAGEHCLVREEKTMTRTACLALLGPTHEDLWMDRQGERLRQAIDRKQMLIMRLLKLYGIQPQRTDAGKQAADESNAHPAPAEAAGDQQQVQATAGAVEAEKESSPAAVDGVQHPVRSHPSRETPAHGEREVLESAISNGQHAELESKSHREQEPGAAVEDEDSTCDRQFENDASKKML
jgi:hypothetical protein